MQDSKSGHLSVVSPLFERLLTAQEAADLLGIHHQTIRRLARQGRVPAIRLGSIGCFGQANSTLGSSRTYIRFRPIHAALTERKET